MNDDNFHGAVKHDFLIPILTPISTSHSLYLFCVTERPSSDLFDLFGMEQQSKTGVNDQLKGDDLCFGSAFSVAFFVELVHLVAQISLVSPVAGSY